jgi:hypothetical protein
LAWPGGVLVAPAGLRDSFALVGDGELVADGLSDAMVEAAVGRFGDVARRG